MADDFKVYWQPGCSSCLRAKEFLATRGIAYESINVRARPEAMEELANLGAQSVPVVVQGKRFVFAQDLGDLARFIGVAFDRAQLPPAELVRRIDLILAATQRYLGQFPAADLEEGLPGRERNILDLGYHIFVIPAAFLDAAHGARLTFDYFERRPGPDMRSAAQVQPTARPCVTRSHPGGAGPIRDASARSTPTTASTQRSACWSGRRGTPPNTRVSSWRCWSSAGFHRTAPWVRPSSTACRLPEGVYDDEVKLAADAGG